MNLTWTKCDFEHRVYDEYKKSARIMYPALIKRQLTRRPAFHITRLAQASLHEKSQPNSKANEEFFVNTTFPDDYDDSPLKPDLEKPTKAEAATSQQETTEQHRADIYESLWGEKAGGKVKEKTTARDEALEAEHEPDMDEM